MTSKRELLLRKHLATLDGDVVAEIYVRPGKPFRPIATGRRHIPVGQLMTIKAGMTPQEWESMFCELPMLEMCEVASLVQSFRAQPHGLYMKIVGRRRRLLYIPDLELRVEREFARAVSTGNIYPMARYVLVQAGLERVKPEAVAMREPDAVDELARVLGTDREGLVPLFHPTNGRGTIDFFGVTIRAIHRESKLRRVSPRALKLSPHVRAVWHLRPFSFDPATKERLLSECPVCSKPLGFSVTKGVAFCDHCVAPGRFGELWPSVDLRDFPQPLVEVEDLEALDFVTGLVDPEPAVRRVFKPALHGDLAAFDRGELF